MRVEPDAVLSSAVRFYAPLALLFALALLAPRAAGSGVGLMAGAAFALVLVLHVLLYGATAARRAFPAQAGRAVLTLGVIAALIGEGAPALPFAERIVEAGLMLATVGALSLVLHVFVGRAPTLRDEGW